MEFPRYSFDECCPNNEFLVAYYPKARSRRADIEEGPTTLTILMDSSKILDIYGFFTVFVVTLNYFGLQNDTSVWSNNSKYSLDLKTTRLMYETYSLLYFILLMHTRDVIYVSS